MTPEEWAIKMTMLEQSCESNTRRIETLEHQTEALNDIATSVKLLVAEQKHQTEAMLEIKNDVAQLDQKVETIEKKPADRWNMVVENAIKLFVAAVLGYVIAQIGF